MSQDETKHVPIRIATLTYDEPLPFDVYVKVGERFLLYIHKNDPIETERAEKILAKGYDKLYLSEGDVGTYDLYLRSRLKNLGTETMTLKEQAELASDTMITIAENIEPYLENEANYLKTREKVVDLIRFLTSEKGSLTMVLEAAGVSVDNFEHASNVAFSAMMVAMDLGIKDELQLFELGLAGLVHDIGHKALDFDPNVEKGTLTPEQLAAYHQHPDTGAAMLKAKSFLSQNLLNLVANHEEIGTGGGFPRKKKLKDLSVLSQVLNLCNDYDRFARQRNLSPVEAMKSFFEASVGLFELDHMIRLRNLLTVKPLK